ncbi:phage antirepressor KilAC domain-containing protein [Paenibacillus taiwanensis]|uniref:phage antirepressor KilAC domain-containing protein n=1 Tax=Paenibacillus taiwanensis TaxID=401638 RepID=UPI00048F7ABF|nr:phage antirepressor [Paenibacillus taiwanensis]
MNQLQVFNFSSHAVRVVIQDGQPWWIAKDVCDVLELSNPSMSMKALDEDERAKFNLGRQGETNIVNEPGLYSLILSSRKPEAKQFKRWVTHEVLPNIRKHGMYATDDLLNNPDLLIAAGQKIKEEQEARKRLELQIELDKPLVNFAKALETSKDSILVRELAKIISQNGYQIGGNTLLKRLREDGYLIKQGSDWNQPTQRSMKQGLFEVKKTMVFHNSGNSHVNSTPLVTVKGQKYFLKKYLEGAA